MVSHIVQGFEARFASGFIDHLQRSISDVDRNLGVRCTPQHPHFRSESLQLLGVVLVHHFDQDVTHHAGRSPIICRSSLSLLSLHATVRDDARLVKRTNDSIAKGRLAGRHSSQKRHAGQNEGTNIVRGSDRQTNRDSPAERMADNDRGFAECVEDVADQFGIPIGTDHGLRSGRGTESGKVQSEGWHTVETRLEIGAAAAPTMKRKHLWGALTE